MPISGTQTAYPANLPVPQAAGVQSAERRVLSAADGLFEARVGQTDRSEFQDVTFPPFTVEQAERFQAWWKYDLRKGGIWFNAVWPLPRGWVSAIRKFVEPPRWEFIENGRGLWRVTAQFELRGTGELPIDPDPPSAWNPHDMLSADEPVPIELTESFRLATRERNSESFEGGVRGVLAHSGSGKWYLELLVVSTGDGANPIVDNQNLSFGLVDDSKPSVEEGGTGDSSYSTDGQNYVLQYTRFDGVVGRRDYPAAGALIGNTGGQAQPGDIFGFAWDIGTGVTVYRNGVQMLSIALAYAGPMFPYMSAGLTQVNGPDIDGQGESVRICTGKRQFAYHPPAGFFAWG